MQSAVLSIGQLAIRHCQREGRYAVIPLQRGATQRRLSGVLYLYTKTIERAHTPAAMWERVTLSNNYSRALQQVLDFFEESREVSDDYFYNVD